MDQVASSAMQLWQRQGLMPRLEEKLWQQKYLKQQTRKMRFPTACKSNKKGFIMILLAAWVGTTAILDL